MQRVAAGDVAAYRALSDRHLTSIHAFAVRMLRDRAAADDIAQETFLRLWQHAGRYRPEARLSTYLHRIAHNLCIDLLRKRRPQTEVSELGDHGDRPSGLLRRKRTTEAVQEALATLPERQRSALSLVHYQGLSQKEAAEVLDVSVEALESLLARARRSLKERLADLVKEMSDD